jgi:hypothetical protein
MKHLIRSTEDLKAWCGTDLTLTIELKPNTQICERCTKAADNHRAPAVEAQAVQSRPKSQRGPRKVRKQQWVWVLEDGFEAFSSTAADAERECRKRAANRPGSTVITRDAVVEL